MPSANSLVATELTQIRAPSTGGSSLSKTVTVWVRGNVSCSRYPAPATRVAVMVPFASSISSSIVGREISSTNLAIGYLRVESSGIASNMSPETFNCISTEIGSSAGTARDSLTTNTDASPSMTASFFTSIQTKGSSPSSANRGSLFSITTRTSSLSVPETAGCANP